MCLTRGGLIELCNKERMDEAVFALNRLSAWFGKVLGISRDGFWKATGNTFSLENVVSCVEKQDLPLRPMAVIDFSVASDSPESRLSALHNNGFYTTLCQLGITMTPDISYLESTSKMHDPFVRVKLSVDSVELVEKMPQLCEDIIHRPTLYISEKDQAAMKQNKLGARTPTLSTTRFTNVKSLIYWKALCIKKEDYLQCLREELFRDEWQLFGEGFFGKKTPRHIESLRECLRHMSDVDARFDKVKAIVESIPDEKDEKRHPKVEQLYKRLKEEIRLICERNRESSPERLPSPSSRMRM